MSIRLRLSNSDHVRAALHKFAWVALGKATCAWGSDVIDVHHMLEYWIFDSMGLIYILASIAMYQPSIFADFEKEYCQFQDSSQLIKM